MALKDWSETAANNDDADATINWLEGQAPSTVNGSARSMMAALKIGVGHIVSIMQYIPANLHAGIKAATNTDDLVTYIQEAEDYLAGLANGGTLVWEDGLYHSSQITKKYKVSWRGKVGQNWPVVAGTAVGARLKMVASLNEPLIVNDRTTGDVGGTGLDGASNRAMYSTIENMAFDGNRSNQTSIDADLIRLEGAWSCTIRGCMFMGAKGFGLRLLDCNEIFIRSCFASGAPIFMEECADCYISPDTQWGGTVSPMYPVLWLSGSGCWKNSINGFFFNNALNVAITQPTFTVSSISDVATTSIAHGVVNDTPVVVTTTGTLPSPLSAGTTYYADVTDGTDKIKFATSRVNRGTGTFVDITSAGTGTHTVGVGENCNVYLNSGAQLNNFAVGRVDQGYGDGFRLRNATENSIGDGFTIVGNGLGNLTAVSGVKLLASTKNRISSLIQGSTETVGANTSNQTIGIDGDSTSTNNQITAKVHDHSTADIQMTAGYKINDELEEKFFDAQDFFAVNATTPAMGTVGGSRRPAFLFDGAGADELVANWFKVPKHWAGFTSAVHWVNAGAGSGDAVWTVSGFEFTAGDSLNQADNQVTALTATTAGAQDVETVTSPALQFTCTPNKRFSLRLKRTSTDAGDTLANDAGVIGLKLTRA